MNDNVTKRCDLKHKLLLLEVAPLRRENRELRTQIKKLEWQEIVTQGKMYGGFLVLIIIFVILIRKSFHFSYEKDYRITIGKEKHESKVKRTVDQETRKSREAPREVPSGPKIPEPVRSPIRPLLQEEQSRMARRQRLTKGSSEAGRRGHRDLRE